MLSQGPFGAMRGLGSGHLILLGAGHVHGDLPVSQPGKGRLNPCETDNNKTIKRRSEKRGEKMRVSIAGRVMGGKWHQKKINRK